MAECLLLAHLYGPAARCKPKVTIWRSWVLRFCIRPLTERLSSWPSWISARARSHSRLGPEGHKGHLITNALARPFLHLLISTRRPRRETTAFGDQPEPSPRSHPSLVHPMRRAAVATWGGDGPFGEPERVHFKPPLS